MDIKPIETVYNGYRFRSRLEARCGVLLNGMSKRYEYEPEGIEAPDGTKYLPDFYIPDEGIYIEAKQERTGWEDDIKRMAHIYECYHGMPPTMIITEIPEPTEIECIYWYRTMYYDTLMDEVRLGLTAINEGDDGYIAFIRTCYKCHEDSIGLWRVLDKERFGKGFEDLRPIHNKNIDYESVYHGHDTDEFGDVIETVEVVNWRYDEDFPTPILCKAYSAARQARFEHGEKPE